jgi:hypothetical protein
MSIGHLHFYGIVSYKSFTKYSGKMPTAAKQQTTDTTQEVDEQEDERTREGEGDQREENLISAGFPPFFSSFCFPTLTLESLPRR